jgi:excisionase family DNA binding protein
MEGFMVCTRQLGLKKKAYSIREIAEITGFGKTHIYEECRKGNIQLRKSGKKTIVLEEELNRYLSALPVYQPINN